jgi:hypothetical protein
MANERTCPTVPNPLHPETMKWMIELLTLEPRQADVGAGRMSEMAPVAAPRSLLSEASSAIRSRLLHI